MIEVCAICVISHTILCTRFSYVEEFSILPCPTCPPCQTYVSVGLSYDTLADTVARHVSKIERCIRYDGYAACLGMFKMNIEHARFWGCVYRTYGLVCLIEDLRIPNMVRKPKPKPNPNKSGTYLPNGRAAKRGLNRSILKSYMGRFGQILAYKCQVTDNRDLITVNPAYTSQQCSHCGHVDKHNRESQAIFVCQSCGMRMNADVNAAINIRERGIRHLTDIQSTGGALSALTL